MREGFKRVSVDYEVPGGYVESDYDLDEGRFECPVCGEYEAVKYIEKMIGECRNCGANLRFKKKCTTFIEAVGDSE